MSHLIDRRGKSPLSRLLADARFGAPLGPVPAGRHPSAPGAARVITLIWISAVRRLG